MLTSTVCSGIFQKLIKTKPKEEFNESNGHTYLLYKLGDYELFVEIGPDFRTDYQVRMVVTHDPHHVGEE